MDRRSFLRTAGVGGVVLSSGCAGLFGDGPTQTPTPPPTPTPEPVVEILEQELVDGDGDEETRVEVLVENVSGRSLGEVRVSAQFFAAAGGPDDGETAAGGPDDGETAAGGTDVEGTAVGGADGTEEEPEVVAGKRGFVNGMAPDQQWLTALSSGQTEGIDDVQVEVAEQTPPGDLGTDHVDVVDDELIRNDDGVVFSAVARNVGEEPLEDVEVACTFTDADGTLLGNAFVALVGPLGVDEDQRVSVRYASPVEPADAVDGYQVTAAARTDT